MYTRDTCTRERIVDRKAPSFSSTLLDEIYRSIDDGSAAEIRSKDRIRLADKWIETKKKKKPDDGDDIPKRNMLPLKSELNKKKLHDINHNDGLFFSSGYNSSDSYSSLFTDKAAITTKTRLSYFQPLKPILTSINAEKTIGAKAEQQQSDDAQTSTRSRASKLYAHLKKMKQPISPGMNLTTFVNSILPNSKSKGSEDERKRMMRESKPTCFTATSFNRSYMSHKTTMSSNNVKTGVQAIRKRALNHLDSEIRHEPGLKMEVRKAKNSGETRLAEDEASEYCSEDDLFEIDHLKPRFVGCDELPVYQTTSNNRVTRDLKL